MTRRTQSDSNYGVHSIQIHEGLDGIRKRPGMYLGEQGSPMVFQMLKEIVDNSVDEFLAGRNKFVHIVANTESGDIWVYDLGGGIPVGQHSKIKVNTLTAVFSMIHAGGKFDSNAYSKSVGTFGTGSSATNAVSEVFEVWTNWKGYWYYQGFAKGKPTTDVEDIDEIPEEVGDAISGFNYNKGTLIHFRPDLSVVAANKSDKATLNLNQVAEYLKTLSYLNGGLKLSLTSETHNKTITFHNSRGMVSLLEDRIEKLKLEQVVNKTLTFSDKDLSFALAWTSYDEDDGLWSYVNCSRTNDGGKHLDGFMAAYLKALTAVAKEATEEKDSKVESVVKRGKRNTSKSRMEINLDKISQKDLKVGLLGVLNIHMSGAIFSSQTKDKLTSDVSKQVEELSVPVILKFFRENPQVAKNVINRAKTVASSREQFKTVLKNLSSMKKSGGMFLPDVLTSCPDCSPDEREVFVVEGISAGGCFLGDTKVLVMLGEFKSSMTFSELVSDQERGVYHRGVSYSEDGKAEIFDIDSPRVTGYTDTLVSIELEDGETVTCTPDHLWLLKSGEYKRADELTLDDDLQEV